MPDIHATIRAGAALSAQVTGGAALSGTAQTGVPSMDHSRLGGRDKPGAHPMEAIAGLIAALAGKADGMEVDEQGLVYLKSGEKRIAGPFGPFGGGGGGGSTNSAKLTVKNTTGWIFTSVAEQQECRISLHWTSVQDGLSTGKGTLRIYVGNSLKSTMSVEQGDVSADVRGWLAAGENTVRMEITDVYGNNQSLQFSVEVVVMSVSSTFDGNAVFSGPIIYYYTPYGAVEKTIHFLLDGVEIGVQTVLLSGQQQEFLIPAQRHGSHRFDVRMSAAIGESSIEAEPLFYDLICAEPGYTQPIIASTFRTEKVEQYDTFVIPYRVYDPMSLTAAITLERMAEDGSTEVLQSLTVDRTEQKWSHRLDTVGDHELFIRCGQSLRQFSMEATASTVHAKPVTNNLILSLSAMGRSNAETDPLRWEYGGIACRFEGFNLKTDGWQLDEDGVTVMRVAGDSRITIPLKLFEKDLRTSGQTIELEFSTRKVFNYDAVLLSCMSGGRGVLIDARQAAFSSAQSAVSVPYKDEEHLRIAFVVEKKAANRLILVYINGIMSGAVQYPADDDFSQAEPVEITIGTGECTLDIYHIRVYSADLTRQQVLNNWIADTQIGALRKERDRRNQVYDSYGRITTETISSDLPYLVVSAPVLPQYKGDKKTISDRFVNPNDPGRSYTSEGTQADVQGTSSQYYYRKNYKLKYKSGLKVGETIVEVYAMNDSAIPVAVFTLKADVASSEGYFNVILAKLFNKYHPIKIPAMETDPRVRYSIDGFPIALFWNDGAETVFLGKYNYNNDKGTPEPFGLSGADERWEVLQNGTPLVGFHSADFSGNWKEDFEGNYPDGNTDITNLKAMCEWVASTKGTAEKFGAELGDHFVPAAADYYMVFTECFLCHDQREKNVLWRYDSRLQRWLPDGYDFDSSIGFNNQAQPAFEYWMEDIDHTADGEPVYNGQNSVFWQNMRAARPEQLKAEWHRLREAGLSYESVMAEILAHKSQWCEAVYNEDMQTKYIDPLILSGDGTYLSFLRGDKIAFVQWFLSNRFRYLDSKYEYGDSLTNMTTIRTNVMQNLTLTYFIKMYGHVRYNAETVSIRVEKDTPYEFVSQAAGAEDRVIGILDADMVTDMGDLSGHMVELIDLSKMIRLQRLVIGSGAEVYENRSLTSLTLGNNVMLKHIDARNCPELKNTIDASGCTGLEEAYFDGTGITGLTLPNGGVLKTLHLPGSVVNLTLRNQPSLTEFVIPDAGQITTLWIENTPAVDPLTIIPQMPANSRVRVIGLNMAVSDAYEAMEFFNHLNTMRGIDENGNNVDTAQVSGTVTVEAIRQSQLESLRAKYPSITFAYNELLPDISVELVQRTLRGEYRNKTATSIGKRAFYGVNVNHVTFDAATFIDEYNFNARGIGAPYLKTANFPKVERLAISGYIFERQASSLKTIGLPNAADIGSLNFDTVNLNVLDLPRLTAPLRHFAFGWLSVKALILRNTEQIVTAQVSSAFSNSSIASGTGYVYVPRTMADGSDGVAAYKAATNWSTYADQIRAIEDYTVDGTVTGELDYEKMGVDAV